MNSVLSFIWHLSTILTILGIILLIGFLLLPDKENKIIKLIDNPKLPIYVIGAEPFLRKRTIKQNKINEDLLKKKIENNEKVTVAFFHPFCYSGGGGERVLWVAIDTILKKYKNFEITIYMKKTDLTKKEILDKIKNQFNLNIDGEKINFIQLDSWKLIVAETYPIARLFLQNAFSVITGMEALSAFQPDIFVETVGFGFINPAVKIFFNCRVVSYVHYPTISTDMIDRVANRVEDVTNSKAITSSSFLSSLKNIYYHIVLRFYRNVGEYTDSIMTNSTWTNNHVLKLWQKPERTSIVYPPMDSTYLSTFDITNKRKRQIISLAQFRPEKAHHVQIEAYANLLEKHPEYRTDPSKITKFFIIGGCRNENDEKLVDNLKSLIKEKNLEDFITILPNLPYIDLCEYLKTSLIGIHTMKDEHFGISNIEFMASGLIILAHKSAGPLLDIVVPDENGNKTGFLASTYEEYADCLYDILEMKEEDLVKLRTCARNHVQKKFSLEMFEQGFMDSLLRGLKVE